MNQKTIKNEIKIIGEGLHTGCKVNVTFKPAEINQGISFIRVDLPQKPKFKACPETINTKTGIPRCTTIGHDNVIIHTVEHLMSALCGLGLSNLIVEMDAPELPGLDGSSQGFVDAIKKAGIAEQSVLSVPFNIKEPLGVNNNGSSIYVVPDESFKISYLLDYPHSNLKSQFLSLTVNEENFVKEIAPCRTFCTEDEANALKDSGLGKGANYKNTLVVGKDGVIDNELRFNDEFTRHKILDFIGDLYLLGRPITGHVYAIKSGHLLNLQLVHEIQKQMARYDKRGFIPGYCLEGKKEINNDEIMKILPHRYPFLLVDKVVDIEKGKKGTGIKNVTINDNFFQGHFPTKPIMPGVLMVEAMAQTAGVVILTNEAHKGKVAFFLSVDQVKFRKVVVPGDQLVMDVEVVRDRSKTATVRGVARVNGELVAEADMAFSFVDAAYLD